MRDLSEPPRATVFELDSEAIKLDRAGQCGPAVEAYKRVVTEYRRCFPDTDKKSRERIHQMEERIATLNDYLADKRAEPLCQKSGEDEEEQQPAPQSAAPPAPPVPAKPQPMPASEPTTASILTTSCETATPSHNYPSVSKYSLEITDTHTISDNDKMMRGLPYYLSPPRNPHLEDATETFKQNMRDLCRSTKSDVQLSDVIGNEDAVQALSEVLLYPIKYKTQIQPNNIPTGVLLYGPPGSGKTMLVRAMINKCNMNMIPVTPADLLSQYLGQSEKNIQHLISVAIEMAPCVVFLDEVDSLMGTRSDQDSSAVRNYKNQILSGMNKLEEVKKRGIHVVLIGATNLPWDIDSASRRRFQKRIYVGLPNAKARERLFRLYMPPTAEISDSEYTALASRTEKHTGDDIRIICSEADFRRASMIEKAKHAVCVDVDGKLKYIPLPPQTGCCFPTCECSKEFVNSRAVPLQLGTLSEDEIVWPSIRWSDLFHILQNFKRSVSDEELQKHENFHF